MCIDKSPLHSREIFVHRVAVVNVTTHVSVTTCSQAFTINNTIQCLPTENWPLIFQADTYHFVTHLHQCASTPQLACSTKSPVTVANEGSQGHNRN